MLLTDEAQFNALSDQGFNRIPIVLETPADLDTPLGMYLKLGNKPYSYLLESVVGGERFGRYSFIGLPAKKRLEVRDKEVCIWNNENKIECHTTSDPLLFIRDYLKRFHVAPIPQAPRFSGGLVGYLAYDIISSIEPSVLAKQRKQEDPIGTPDILLLLSDEIVVIDNLSGTAKLIVYAKLSSPQAYLKACERLHDLLEQLRTPVTLPEDVLTKTYEPVNITSEASFKDAVKKAKEYIHAGDIMQVVLSRRVSQRFDGSPLSFYRCLRKINPSPYMFYYHFDSFHVVGTSPEILVRLESGQITIRPIAGTRPRGQTIDQDIQFEEQLLQDPKECAEHVMLLDLGRNDMGRIAQTSSIKITQQMHIERYSHVMHMVSNIEGLLRPNLDAIDVLKASFPAGTVSGAPKVRAMQLIAELESIKRGIYSGAVGYIGFNGEMDFAITLRTAIIKDAMLHAQTGAGIVADSDPDLEWEETNNKIKAILRAAQEISRR